jgi:hypothetical protein
MKWSYFGTVASLAVVATLVTTEASSTAGWISDWVDGSHDRPAATRHTHLLLPEYVGRSLEWLAAAQFDNGGWGAGRHSAQQIRDPHAVQIDPATTAFATMALIRSGSSLEEGRYQANVRRAVNYLLDLVESYPEEGSNITSIEGTQPQSKLGQNIDVAMVAQLFSRVLPLAVSRPALSNRVTAALDKCLRKIERTQQRDGSWGAGGWAPVLQSAMANSALELGMAAGRRVDPQVLARSRDYQKDNIDAATGSVKTEASAGVSLYSIASSQRASAPEARDAIEGIKQAKKKGLLAPDADVSADNLFKAGFGRDEAERLAYSYRQNQVAQELLQDDVVFSGFGNNGGEEYLSYMLTSESLAVTGGAEYRQWITRMHQLFVKIQNPNGSWSGHHCITSPVFCTAAVLLTVTADRDAAYLAQVGLSPAG